MNEDRKSDRFDPLGLVQRVNTDWLGVLVTLGILVASLIPRSQAASLSPFNDQIQHIIAYGTLAFLTGWRRRSLTSAVFAVIAIVAFSAAIEVIQPWFGRDGELRDLVANCIGVGAGFAAVRGLRWMSGFAWDFDAR